MIINPIVFDGSGKGTDIFTLNLKNRIIYLVGEITDDMAASVISQLLQLASEGDEDIRMYINSPGGSVSAGLAIYDTMQLIKPDVATICMGNAASMGAIILSGGKKGKRTILPHSEVMIHQPYSGIQGKASDIIVVSEHIKKTKQLLSEILADNCDKDIKYVMKDIELDYWMDAEEAVTYGIVDNIAELKWNE